MNLFLLFSIECGFSSGCVKIYIDTEEMMLRKQAEEGINTLPERYLGNPVLRRGLFAIFLSQILEARFSVGILDQYSALFIWKQK